MTSFLTRPRDRIYIHFHSILTKLARRRKTSIYAFQIYYSSNIHKIETLAAKAFSNSQMVLKFRAIPLNSHSCYLLSYLDRRTKFMMSFLTNLVICSVSVSFSVSIFSKVCLTGMFINRFLQWWVMTNFINFIRTLESR